MLGQPPPPLTATLSKAQKEISRNGCVHQAHGTKDGPDYSPRIIKTTPGNIPITPHENLVICVSGGAVGRGGEMFNDVTVSLKIWRLESCSRAHHSSTRANVGYPSTHTLDTQP